ncbi:TetR family transcriptional regulator [Galbitalea soli]|uniref:TetR/AcrR family transcriptional regulator n=1 Tax=Galbitalea soli TaxID=1268042 RepID=A0A7C9TT88_9MICO|nr:TetR family transcriptional regulator [Galbitalea soli]NEM92204.1 TetR/AcrR family transcriptional regulator [Galbitalea soli]NYJ31842.1 AcrR family transcriptional regulator [Galbitalea soli]
MRSTKADDATTSARIREAAIALFGRDGVRATTVRAIAERCGVSPALVIHHFGSKEGLRHACDEWILAEIMAASAAITDGGPGTSAAIRQWLTDIDAHRPWLDYIGRAITDGSALGDRLFDDFVQQTRELLAAGEADGTVRASSDADMRAVILTAYGLSTLVFERQIGRASGAVGLTPAVAARMAIPALELFTGGLYTSDRLLQATRDAIAASPEGATG